MIYVTMTDRFMSGWGMAQNKTNKLVIVCDTYAQAYLIEKNAKNRREMRYVNVRTTKPYYGSNVLTTWKTFEEMGGPWLNA